MRGADCDQNGVFERRKVAAFPKLQLLLKVTGEIVMPRKLDRRTKGRVGLHENFTQRFAATGPPRHLGEQLKSSFARPEIGKMQRQIGVDDSDQGHVWKMQTLGDHLCSDQDVDLPGAEIS